MEIALRDFRRHDFEALWRIDQDCFPVGIAYSRQELSSYIQRRGAFTFVADAGQQPIPTRPPEDPAPSGIVGFVVGEANSRGRGHIVTIDVLPIARRSGVGSMLLQAAEDRLRVARCVRVRLETASDNASAHAFYDRHGYARVGILPAYYGNGQDAVSLEKPL